MHERVNPLAPIPNGFAIKLPDPATGEPVFLDDCFRYAGDLVDGDIKAGDFAEAKGPAKAFLYSRSWSLDDDVKQAAKELRAANQRGVGLKWYYAEPHAAAIARQAFIDHGLTKIVVGIMPPR